MGPIRTCNAVLAFTAALLLARYAADQLQYGRDWSNLCYGYGECLTGRCLADVSMTASLLLALSISCFITRSPQAAKGVR
jgi:hypothetical protein